MLSNKRHVARASAALGLAATLLLCGCATAPATRADGTPKPAVLIPTEQYAVKVTSAPEQIAIGLHPQGLSANQQAALSEFVSRWRDDGGGLMTLRIADDSQNLALTRRMQIQVSNYLIKLGLPAEQLRLAGYHAGGDVSPVLISYERYVAEHTQCGLDWENLTATKNNTPYKQFGCSMTANMAAMVANPRDMLAPAVVTPADDVRREVVLGKYRRGDVTSSAKDAQADGKSTSTQ